MRTQEPKSASGSDTIVNATSNTSLKCSCTAVRPENSRPTAYVVLAKLEKPAPRPDGMTTYGRGIQLLRDNLTYQHAKHVLYAWLLVQCL